MSKRNTKKRCSVCLRSIKQCEKEDFTLLTPFTEKNKKPGDTGCGNYDLGGSRWLKAYSYSLGLYNPQNRRFYNDNLSIRQTADVYIKLPLCIWEGEYIRLWCYLNATNRENISCLPLPKSTKKKLRKFFTKQIHEYCESLPRLSTQ